MTVRIYNCKNFYRITPIRVIFGVVIVILLILNYYILRNTIINAQLHLKIRNKREVVEFPKYNNSDIRDEKWKFSTKQNYPDSLLFPYTPVAPWIKVSSTIPGEMGDVVKIPDHLKKISSETFKLKNINLIASNMILNNRTIRDQRSKECIEITYPPRLPKASVIIIFHNEPWSTLQRSIWSVVIRSPKELIQEIILVDDCSSENELKKPLNDYIKTIPATIRIIRTEKREGLIRARLIGAKQATGSVFIFLDAHTEATDGWLEPLLTRIAGDRSVIAEPTVERISNEDMSYMPQGRPVIHVFDLDLVLYWLDASEREMNRLGNDRTKPYRTPIIVGCAFAVDREFFYEIGTFDEQMQIWGAENIELPVRVWLCGGLVEIIPCSHVGHMYRSSTYSFEGDEELIKMKNLKRTTELWFDNYKEFFYIKNQLAKSVNYGDLSSRIKIKEKFKCKSFEWFLKNIYPENLFDKVKFIGYLQIDDQCMDEGLEVPAFYQCHYSHIQIFTHNIHNQLASDHNKCVTVNLQSGSTKYLDCVKDDQNQKFILDRKNRMIVHEQSKLCLYKNSTYFVNIKACNATDRNMLWKIKSAFSL